MLTYEDFPVGKSFPLGPRKITAEEIIAFAERYDPQPFHLDGESEQATAVGGLIASGWHTCSILMRMMCDAYLLNTASQGSGGLDKIKWLRPIRPDDTLTGAATVMGRRVSKSNPGLGLINFAYTIQNQHAEPVLEVTGMGMVDTGAAPQ
ncbi:MAG: MaoC family dehydratase [Pseudomonadota bacterium]